MKKFLRLFCTMILNFRSQAKMMKPEADGMPLNLRWQKPSN